MPNKALIAMSGGVDSTVAALLSLRDGYDCIGATMKLHDFESTGVSSDTAASTRSTGGTSDTAASARSANDSNDIAAAAHSATDRDDFAAASRFAADRLGIPFFVFDFRELFTKQVIDPFVTVYRGGRTPNPCVNCNKHIKFGAFLEKALEIGRDFVVTGHYAQTECDAGGRYILKKGSDATKDQSYVLYTLSQEQLARARFPLGGLSKRQVREIARDAGLENISSDESQDICFIPGGDYTGFISRYTGDAPRKGRFVDTDGVDLGENKGVVSYTIGQRHGLGLAMPHPTYVLELRPEDDTVVVGRNEQLYTKTLNATGINLIPVDKLDTPLRAHVKIRYADPGHQATVCQTGEDTLRIEFDEPQRAITKGQSAVIYDGDVVIGGGIIK